MTTLHRKLHRRTNRSGAVAVEFALTVPILFSLLLGSLELGHASMVLNTAEAACYEGARMGIIPGASVVECEQAARQKLTSCKIRNAQITVTPNNLESFTPTVTVRIVVPYSSNAITVPFFTRSLVIQRECTLTRERA